MTAETVETVLDKLSYHLTEARLCQLKLRELQPSQPHSISEDGTDISILKSIGEIKKSIKDLALKTSKEISQIRRGQMDIMDILDTTHDIVNGVTDLVLNDNTAYEYKRTGSSGLAATRAPPASPPRRASAPSTRTSPARATTVTSNGMTNAPPARDHIARMNRILSTVAEKEEDEETASSYDSLLQRFKSSPLVSPRASAARQAHSPSDSSSLDSSPDSILLSLRQLKRESREMSRPGPSSDATAVSAGHRNSPLLPTLLFRGLPPPTDASLIRPTPSDRITPTPEPRTRPFRPLRVVSVSGAPEPVHSVNVNITRRTPSGPESSRPTTRRTPAAAEPARAPTTRGASTTTRRAAPAAQPSRSTTRGPSPAPRTAAPSTSTRRKTSKAPGYLAHTANSMLRTVNFPFDAQSALATKRGPRGTRK